MNETSPAPKKPPIGVMPYKYWVEHRIFELMRAIGDYKYEMKRGEVPKLVLGWAEELVHLLRDRA